METKTFSVKDGSLRIEDGFIELWVKSKDYYNANELLASNNPEHSEFEDVYQLPSTLIHNPKTDEELAEEVVNKSSCFSDESFIEDFLAGRKSVGGGFHLTREELEKFMDDFRESVISSIYEGGNGATNNSYFIDSLHPPIYPHTITVEHDGNNYLWETLKASYE